MSTNFMIQSLGPISRYPFTNSLIDGCCGTQLCCAISQSSLHIPLFDVRTNPVPTVTFHRVGPLYFRMFHEADPPNSVSRQARLVLPFLPVKWTYSHLTRSAFSVLLDQTLTSMTVEIRTTSPNSRFLPCRSPARRSYQDLFV